MRIHSTFLACATTAILAAGCRHSSSPANSADATISFESMYVNPGSPVAGEGIVFSATVEDFTSNGTVLSKIPWTLSRDGVLDYFVGVIPPVPANGSVSFGFIISESIPGQHTYVLIIDPANITSRDGPSSHMRSVTLMVSPHADG